MVRGSLTLGSSTSFSFRDEHGAQLCYHIVDYGCRQVQMFYASRVLLFLQPRALHTFRSQLRTGGGTNQPFLFLTFPFALPTLCALSSCLSIQSAPRGHQAFTSGKQLLLPEK